MRFWSKQTEPPFYVHIGYVKERRTAREKLLKISLNCGDRHFLRDCNTPFQNVVQDNQPESNSVTVAGDNENVFFKPGFTTPAIVNRGSD